MQHQTTRTPIHPHSGGSAPTSLREPETQCEICESLAELLQELKAELHQPSKQGLGSPHLSLAEAAIYLGITRDTLERKIARGEMPVHRRPGMRPYFLKREIDAWLEDPATLTQIQEEDEEDGYPNCACENDVIKDLLEEAECPEENPVHDPVA